LKTFEELGVSEDIRRAISELGFEQPMPVQEQAIPYLLHASAIPAEAAEDAAEAEEDTIYNAMSPDELRRAIDRNRKLMREAAKKLEFLQAEEYKQEVVRLEELLGNRM